MLPGGDGGGGGGGGGDGGKVFDYMLPGFVVPRPAIRKFYEVGWFFVVGNLILSNDKSS